MSDAVASVLARKVALDAARAALRSGARSELERALAGLPLDGRKAAVLREEIKSQLGGTRTPAPGFYVPKRSLATCVSDGINYEFRLAETGDVAFFVVERIGAVVRVTINSAHEFGRHMAKQDDLNSPTVLALLAAWAHHELDQTSEKRQQELRHSRVDWGRVMRRILSAEDWPSRG